MSQQSLSQISQTIDKLTAITVNFGEDMKEIKAKLNRFEKILRD